jgi:NAD+ diphosphatase
LIPGFTGGALDRSERLRHDPDAFAAARADRAARVLKLSADAPEVGADGRLGWVGTADLPETAELLLLGLGDGLPHFVAHVPGERLPAGRSPALTAALEALQPGEAATYAAARSLLAWHERHGFCANCGAPTTIFRAGWGRSCAKCGAEHFPRVDPVVIMLAEHEDRVLLGRQASWPARRYSALAGFLEPGESAEEAVAREIAEETGVPVGRVRYVASQPWPFPSQLMIACIAEALDDTITIDPYELEDAIWVPRAGVRAALAHDPDAPFLPPPRYAIAHTLLTAWAEGA